MTELLMKLANTDAPSGLEGKLCDLIAFEAKPHADEVTTDLMGNLLVRKRGPGAKLLLACRMDEPAFCVTHIDRKGFLRFAPVGAIPPGNALGARVRLSSGVVGVIRGEKRDPKTETAYEQMFIDLGAKGGKEAERLVRVGDLACFASEVRERKGVLIGKALATRALCAALLRILNSFPRSVNDVTLAFTVQGELSGRGAVVATWGLTPALAIVLEGCDTEDFPGTKGASLALLKGPAILVKDQEIMISPLVRGFMMDVALEDKIPYQLEVSEAPALDARTVQNASGGTLLGVLSLPVRYRRTPHEIITLNDWENLIQLLHGILSRDLRQKGF